MLTDITKLTTKNWQHKRGTIGEAAIDKEDVNQCIRTIATTQKGDVPFAPEFGLNLIEIIGLSAPDAIKKLTVMYIKELPKQEPRIEIVDVAGDYNDNGKITMTVYWKIKDSEKIDKTEVYYEQY